MLHGTRLPYVGEKTMSVERRAAGSSQAVDASGPEAVRKAEWKPWSPNRTEASEADPDKRGRFGRLTTTAGIVLLCVSFFLPQVKGCGDNNIIPSEETIVSGGTSSCSLACRSSSGLAWHSSTSSVT